MELELCGIRPQLLRTVRHVRKKVLVCLGADSGCFGALWGSFGSSWGRIGFVWVALVLSWVLLGEGCGGLLKCSGILGLFWGGPGEPLGESEGVFGHIVKISFSMSFS